MLPPGDYLGKESFSVIEQTMKSSQYQIVTSIAQGSCSTEPRERPPCDATGAASMSSVFGRAQTLQLAEQPLSKICNMHTLDSMS